jgi:hypothetical protein
MTEKVSCGFRVVGAYVAVTSVCIVVMAVALFMSFSDRYHLASEKIVVACLAAHIAIPFLELILLFIVCRRTKSWTDRLEQLRTPMLILQILLFGCGVYLFKIDRAHQANYSPQVETIVTVVFDLVHLIMSVGFFNCTLRDSSKSFSSTTTTTKEMLEDVEHQLLNDE